MTIVTKIALMVSLLMAGVLIAGGITDYVKLHAERSKALNDTALATADRLAQGTAVPIWNLDVQAVEQILVAEMANPSVVGLRIAEGADAESRLRDDPATPLFAGILRGADGSFLPSSQAATGNLIAITRPALRDGQIIGAVEARISLDSMIKAQRAMLVTITINTVVSVGIVVFLVMVILTRLAKRIRTLVQASNRIAAGDYAVPVEDASADEIGRLSRSFAAMQQAVVARRDELQRFNRDLERTIGERTAELTAKNQAMVAEILERERTELSLRLLESACNQIADALVITSGSGGIVYANPTFVELTGCTADELSRRPLEPCFATANRAFAVQPVPPGLTESLTAARSGSASVVELHLRRSDGGVCILDCHTAPIRAVDSSVIAVAIVLRDITERRRLETERSQGQKMESVGQLAAGVAHEINTPIQFIGDNLRFIGDALRDAFTVIDVASALRATVGDRQTAAAYDAAITAADLVYLRDELPKAVSQGIEGVDQVATIVKALKEFSHPGNSTLQTVDLRKSIESTLKVAYNEYKYVADLITDFAPDLPLVECVAGEINQVVLNLVVNASHAIDDMIKAGGARGTITVGACVVAGEIAITISDTGGGIPEAIRSRIFDPFFTTKAVGKGTGQGLFIAHEIIVKHHHGHIAVHSEVGKGTTFTLTLPLVQPVEGPESEPTKGIQAA